MNILFLYSEVMGYTEAVLQAFAKIDSSIEAHCVYWDQKKNTPYSNSAKEIKYYKRSDFKNSTQINDLIEKINPKLIYISGWMDNVYLSVVKKQKKSGIPIIVGLDNQWLGTLKQVIGSIFSLYFIKIYYSYALVAGFRQFEFARKLGFKPLQILSPLYSANLEIFGNKNLSSSHDYKSKRILFVGRLVKEKGILELINVFKKISLQFPEWELKIIGNGELKNLIEFNIKGFKIILEDFMKPELLVQEAQHASFFCLPSNYEPWGVVVHEFAAIGLPLVISNACGASRSFVINNYNGFVFDPKKNNQLEFCLIKMMQKNQDEFALMSNRSIQLSNSINPELIAATILSII